MKAGGGKRKGSEWERQICKFLTKWAGGSLDNIIFWRSPGSGSFVTNKVSMDVSGDIVSILPEGKFFTDIISCEAKTGYDETDLFKHFKPNKNNIIEMFWEQCIKDSKIVNKYGMLIYKKKGYPSIVGIEESFSTLLLKMKIQLPKYITVNFNNELPNMVLYDFEDFFNCVLPEHFKKIGKKLNKKKV